MFDILEFNDILLAHDTTDPNKHKSFLHYPELCKDRKKILNIRRLPVWLVSWWHHSYRSGYIESIDREKIVEGLAPLKGRVLADHELKQRAETKLGGIDYWLRTESLAEDFIRVMKDFILISEEKQVQIRKIKENQGRHLSEQHGNDFLGHKYIDAESALQKFFTLKEVKNIYDQNPFWADVENKIYGNLLYEQEASMNIEGHGYGSQQINTSLDQGHD
ncbi:MAG: hypothetical protein HQL21_03270 [Candidatus Omnitrophica bacterium]|nr:hypothetical protein [Candidatus Omnitrophota bacterium]